MPTILMTFDLEDADEDARERGYNALVPLGLSRVSQNKQLRLPYSSVMGTVAEAGTTAREIHNRLKTVLAEATGCKVTRLIVAVISGWACSGNKDRDLWLDELGVFFDTVEVDDTEAVRHAEPG